MEIFKQKFSKALKDSGKSVNEIAKLTGLSCAAIRNSINMKSIPHTHNVVKICKALNLNIDELMPSDNEIL